jgi:hypothetical protein
LSIRYSFRLFLKMKRTDGGRGGEKEEEKKKEDIVRI